MPTTIIINGITIRLDALSVEDLSAMHKGIFDEVKRRKRIAERERKPPTKSFPGAWPLTPGATEDDR